MRVNNNIAIREVITSSPKDSESHYYCDCGYDEYISINCTCEGCQSLKEHYVTCPKCGVPLIVVRACFYSGDEESLIAVQKKIMNILYDDNLFFEQRIGLVNQIVAKAFRRANLNKLKEDLSD